MSGYKRPFDPRASIDGDDAGSGSELEHVKFDPSLAAQGHRSLQEMVGRIDSGGEKLHSVVTADPAFSANERSCVDAAKRDTVVTSAYLGVVSFESGINWAIKKMKATFLMDGEAGGSCLVHSAGDIQSMPRRALA